MQVRENEEGEPSDHNAGPILVKERGKERSLVEGSWTVVQLNSFGKVDSLQAKAAYQRAPGLSGLLREM